ncbi:MAG: shikimate kinase [Tissierellales bacterium]|nr:shikimate kinase [Tissierellales bacterium]
MKPIVLIGMSGVGKTYIGKKVAEALNFDFYDTDELIIRKNNASIEYLFETYGEKYFREEEKKILKEIIYKNRCVISTGGGIILDIENIDLIKSNGVIFYLYDNIENISNNLKFSNYKRPLLDIDNDLPMQLKEMFFTREKLYLSACHYIIDVSSKDEISIINEIAYNYKTFTC